MIKTIKCICIPNYKTSLKMQLHPNVKQFKPINNEYQYQTIKIGYTQERSLR